MTLGGLRVLFLPHAARQPVLSKIMALGKERHGWQIGIAAATAGPGPNAGLLGDPSAYFAVPNMGRRAAWESDLDRTQAIRELVKACERSSGLPINRIVLAGERILGRAYGREFYRWPSERLTRLVLNDNCEPARAVERLFAFGQDVIETFKPDLVITGQVSSPDAMVIAMLCRQRGIPCFTNRPSKILSHRGFWTDDPLMLNRAARDLCLRRVQSGQPASDFATAFVSDFRSKPRTVAYIERNWRNVRTMLKLHQDLAVQAAVKVRYFLNGRKELEPKPIVSRLWGLYERQYLTWRQRRFFSRLDEAALAEQPYVYVALHKEPELAINVQHPEWHSQKNLISWLSANLPVGYRLLVREHRFNQGRRPTRFYDDIRRYPGVTVIDPFDSQFKYIQRAALIVTDNGTSGWEGLLFGQRVLLLGNNYYSATGLAPVVDVSARIGTAMLESLGDAGGQGPAGVGPATRRAH